MPSKDKVLGKVFGDPQKKIIKRLQKKVDEINALGDKYAQMSDDELAQQTDVLKKRLAKLTKKAQQEEAKKAKKNSSKAKTSASEIGSREQEKKLEKELEKGLNTDRQLVNKMSEADREKYARVGTATIDDFNALDAIRERKAKQRRKDALDVILPDAFAVVREMASRVLGQRHFDVQLMGGIALHEGNVAEMKTGEGKTLVATAPVYLNALTGRGVHMVTVNDYLAQLHGGWMGQLYHALGMSTGVIINDASFIYDPEYENTDHYDKRMSHLRPCSRKEAYAADITYGTNNEFGFDYLRDNMVSNPELLRQRELNFAIVDEVETRWILS